MGSPGNVGIRKTVPANDMKRSVFGHRTFTLLGSNPMHTVTEISALTTELLCFTDGCSHALARNSPRVKYSNVKALHCTMGKIKNRASLPPFYPVVGLRQMTKITLRKKNTVCQTFMVSRNLCSKTTPYDQLYENTPKMI